MNPNIVRKPEQIRLIMECRQSGLSDYQWCKTKNINPGTFYNWVSKLRKSGYTFPESKSKSTGIPAKQEVVKLDLIELLKNIWNTSLRQDQTKTCLTKNLKIWHLGIQKFRSAVPINHKRSRIRGVPGFFHIIHPVIPRLHYWYVYISTDE